MSKQTSQGAAAGGGRKARPAPLSPQLKPRRNAAPEEVIAHQRRRLYAAMIEAVVESGYSQVRTHQLRALAGVSQRTIYDHFPSKEAYFFATYDFVVRGAVERIGAAYRDGEAGGDWSAGLCRAFEAYVAELVERPKASRLAAVEVLGVGPAAQPRIARSEAVFTQMIARSLAQAPDEVALPQLLVRSVVGGVWFVSRTRLLEGRPETIGRCGRELLDWILAYRSPAVERLRPAPPAAAPPPPRPALREGDERTRMLRAAGQLVAADGYDGLSPARVAELAGLRAEAFGRQFGEGVDECFLAALELLATEALARALREGEGSPDWAAAVCRGVRALLLQVAQEPAFARAAFVEVFSLGPAASERRVRLMRSFATVLMRRAPRGARPGPLVAEAVVGSLWSLVQRRVATDRANELPALWGYAAFLALAPVVGAEAALAAIDAELAAGAGEGGAPNVAADRSALPAALS